MRHLQKSIVLLSGGLDSATVLHLARKEVTQFGGTLEAVSMDYGQRHAKEMECAYKLCDDLNIKHTILDIRGALGKDSMLTDKNRAVPDISYDEIKGISPTYVPFRNGFMLSRLAAFAQEYVMKVGERPDVQLTQSNDPGALEDLVTLYIGVHAEDAKNWAYPDCTPEFIGAMSNAIYVGTYNSVRLRAPFLYASKSAIISAGHQLGVPYQDTWSCYKGEDLHCGVCPTCRARKAAFKEADVMDPTKYADDPGF